MTEQILTIKEVADFLKLTEKTAYRLAACSGALTPEWDEEDSIPLLTAMRPWQTRFSTASCTTVTS
jgi:hypothetical protein